MKKVKENAALGARVWGSIVIFGLIGQLAWVVENMYFNVYLFNEIGGTANDIAAMVAASAITAAVTTLFIGVLSDKLRRRKVFITFGYIIWGIITASFGFITVENTEKLFHTANAVSTAAALVIIMDCVMTFFGSTASDAAFNSWVTDVTDEKNRGRAEALMQAMPLLAIIIVFGVLDSFKQRGDWQTFFIIVGAATTAGGILGFFLLKDKPKIEANNDSYFKNIFYGFRPSTVRANKELYITFAAFCILNIAYQVFMPYIIIYLELSLGITDYAVPLGVILILAAAISVVCGRAIDKFGKVKFMIPSIIILIGGFVFMYFATGNNLALLITAGVIMMGAYLVTSAALSATIRDYTPKDKVGLFQGIRMVFQVLLPMVIGPYIGAAVISNNNATYEELGTVKHIPTSAIFLASAAVAFFAVIPSAVLYVMQKKKENADTPGTSA
ncbi:MAG: MFS transporter [Clostridiales bacterium]|nr:MFS transporter [Clostridiales bacterium]